MGFNCSVNEPHGNSKCQDPRLVQLTNDYQKNMQALRVTALEASSRYYAHKGHKTVSYRTSRFDSRVQSINQTYLASPTKRELKAQSSYYL